MLRRVRRSAAAALPLLLVLALAGCGDDDGTGSADAKEGFEAVSISGDLGSVPKVDWKGELEAEKTDTKVLIKGDGKEVADGDKVEVNVWIGNGYTQKESYTTYEDGGTPETFTVDDQLTPLFRDAIIGQPLGSRVAVTAPAAEVFGDGGNPQMDIGNEDSIVIVLDLMAMFKPPGPRTSPPTGCPRSSRRRATWSRSTSRVCRSPRPTPTCSATWSRRATARTLTATSSVTADYLGMVYKGKEPFDESFSAEPVEFSLTEVVKGWTYGLAGLKVGSRVLLQIPPALGYGAQAQDGHPCQQLALLRHRHRLRQVAVVVS